MKKSWSRISIKMTERRRTLPPGVVLGITVLSTFPANIAEFPLLLVVL
jgi:hypothetical protein